MIINIQSIGLDIGHRNRIDDRYCFFLDSCKQYVCSLMKNDSRLLMFVFIEVYAPAIQPTAENDNFVCRGERDR